MGASRIIYPHPIWAIISQPVLATVLVIASGSAHLEGLYPLAEKRFVMRVLGARVRMEKLRVPRNTQLVMWERV